MVFRQVAPLVYPLGIHLELLDFQTHFLVYLLHICHRLPMVLWESTLSAVIVCMSYLEVYLEACLGVYLEAYQESVSLMEYLVEDLLAIVGEVKMY